MAAFVIGLKKISAAMHGRVYVESKRLDREP